MDYKYLFWDLSYETMGIWGRLLYSVPFMLGVFIAAFVYAKSLPRKKFFILRSSICLIICLTVAYFVWPFSLPGDIIVATTIKYILFFALAVFSMRLCFECSFFESLYFCENGVAVFSIAKLLFDIIGCASIYFGWNITPYGALYSLIYLAVAVLVYGGIYFLIVKKGGVSDDFMVDNNTILLPTAIVILVASVVNISMGRYIYYYQLEADIIVLVKSLLIVTCILTIFFNFGAFRIGKQKREIEVIDQLNKQQAEQFKISKETMEIVNVKYHDLKGQIEELEKIVSKGDMEQSLADLRRQIGNYEYIAKTGNECLDVILTEKGLYCQKHGITLNYMADGEALGFMDKIDLVALFGNILNNAVEAVEKLTDPNRKIITLSVHRKENILYIASENYFVGKLSLKDNLPVTTKTDKTSHGYGIKSIRNVVQKYGGSFVLACKDGVFSVNIAVPVS